MSRLKLSKVGIFSRAHWLSPSVTFVALVYLAAISLTVEKSNLPSLLLYVVYFMWIMLAESWNLVGGYAGLLNLGLVAFFGLGSSVAEVALMAGVSFIPAIFLGGVSGALLALALIPTFRLRSDYFAIGTLVVPIIIKPLVELFSGRSNFTAPIGALPSPLELYWTGLVLTGLTIFGISFLMKTRVGLALRAIGDEENASATLGVNILMYKSIALAISGFIAAVAGAYLVGYTQSFNTGTFNDLTYSLFPIFMVVIGGSGTFEGPIVGALIFSIPNYYLNQFFPGSSLETLVFSILIMAVAVLLPKGVVPAARKIVRWVVSKLRRYESPREPRRVIASSS